MINALCSKNGTERPNTCRLHLSLQPRFIARFNQLVSLTSQPWESRHKDQDDDEAEETEENEEELDQEDTGEDDEHPDQEYEQYEEEQVGDDVPEYEEEEEHPAERVTFQEADQATETGLTAAEEDELYEENEDEDEEPFDTRLEPAEALVDEDDDVVEDEVYHATSDHEPYDEAQEEHEPYDEADDHAEYDAGEEERQGEEQFTGEVYTEEQVHVSEYHGTSPATQWWLMGSDTEDATGNDDDDLISYEEAVDQTGEGQDYRQDYLAQDDTTTTRQEQNGEINGNHHDLSVDVPEHIPDDEARPAPSSSNATEPNEPSVGASSSDVDKVASKRSLDEIVDPTVPDPSPRKHPRFHSTDGFSAKANQVLNSEGQTTISQLSNDFICYLASNTFYS